MKQRNAEIGDAAAISRLLGELGYPADEGAVARRLEVLRASPGSTVLVVEEAGTIVAVGGVHVFPVLHADAPVALITALVVAEVARGRGVGRALVAGLEEIARTHDCSRIVVTTALHRADAHAFYERQGYSFNGRRYAKQPL